MIPVYFSLGSNIGDRERNIFSALKLMDEAFSVHYSRLSDIIETPSWGFEAEPFLNCAVLYNLDMDPYIILKKVKSIEKALGRDEMIQFDAQGRRIYHSRTIDIDILCYGRERLSSPELTLPHPMISKRDFVRIPLSQIADAELAAEYPEFGPGFFNVC